MTGSDEKEEPEGGDEAEVTINPKLAEEQRQEMSSTPNPVAKSEKNQQHSETMTSMPSAKVSTSTTLYLIISLILKASF